MRRRHHIQSGLSPRAERLLLGILGMSAIIAAWQIGAKVGYLKPIVFSSPIAVVGALGVQLGKGAFWNSIVVSAEEYVLGFVMAAAFGVVAGLVIGWSKTAFYVFDPWITILYSTPLVALVPTIILVLGIDLGAKVAIVFLIALFPVVVNTVSGVHNTNREFLDVARSFGAGRRIQLRTVVVPGAVPSILTGLRLSGAHAMVAVVVAEFVSGNSGIGFLMQQAGDRYRTADVLAFTLILGAWGVFFAEGMTLVERRFLGWRP